jgi:hypothetical protein
MPSIFTIEDETFDWKDIWWIRCEGLIISIYLDYHSEIALKIYLTSPQEVVAFAEQQKQFPYVGKIQAPSKVWFLHFGKCRGFSGIPAEDSCVAFWDLAINLKSFTREQVLALKSGWRDKKYAWLVRCEKLI